MMDTIPAVVARNDRAPHVLVCDDAQVMRDLLRDLLEDAGYRVSALPSPPDLERLRSLRADAVVLDLLFAGAEDAGWSFLHRVRDDVELGGLPVVLCTGAIDRARDDAASAARRLGVRVVPKPFDIDEMLAVLAEVAGAPGAALEAQRGTGS